MLYINQFLYASSIFQQVEPIIILPKKGTGRKIESLLNAVGIGLEPAVPRFHKGLFDGFCLNGVSVHIYQHSSSIFSIS